VAEAGLRQLRIAETEKYAHVTFFFNGGEERQFPGEERILVPSPKVATYDLQPEMSAPEVTDKLVAAIASGKFDLIVVNYANTDMVGHTGDLAAARKAVEAVDVALGRLRQAIEKAGGVMLITADHGNAEMMFDHAIHQPHTAHTLNRVPVVMVNGPKGVRSLRDGILADIAPTMLALMGLKQPAEMTGHSLLEGAPAAHQARS
jgi:2,3-bisphosphoglycerate-independent phosphoglycerate mutase